MLFDQTIKNINRIREFIQILLKYGFEDVVVNTQLKNLIPQNQKLSWSRQDKSIFEYNRWERVRMLVEELGATFIKFAQVLSNRPDVLPLALIKELEKLQSDVAPFSSQEAKRIIEAETGQAIDELFVYFEDKPLGSASIGQVHRARLHDGNDVVVKVRRPGVKKTVQTDLELIKEFVKLTENYFIKLGVLNPLDIVGAFEKSIKKELDYDMEARNVEQFRNFYKKETAFYVPKAYKELSTDKVLILELVQGCKITDVEQLEAWGLDPKHIAETGMDIYLRQIFEFGYFHADPHPGNILVRKDGVICLIDFGMVGKMMKRDKYAFAGIIVGMARKDARGMAISFKKLAIDSEIEDMRAFEYRLNELIEEFSSLELEEINMAELATGLQKIIYDFKLKVPGSIFLIMRAMVILEGIGTVIYPGFQTFEFLKPYGRKLLLEQFSIKDIGLDMFYAGSQMASFLTKFPGELKYILKKARKGQLHFHVEYHGLEPLVRKLNSIANRLVVTLIICALLVASVIYSSQSVAADSYSGLPALSLIGFILAISLGLVLLIMVVRSRK